MESGLTKSKFFISLLLRYKLSALKEYFLNPYNFIYKIGDDFNVVTEFPCVYGTPCAQNLHKMFCPTLNKHLVSWIIIQTMVDDFNVVTQFPFFWDTLCPKTRDFQITTSLQSNVVDLWYFKL